MRKRFHILLVTVFTGVLLLVNVLSLEAATVHGNITGGNYYGTLNVTTSTAKATLSAAYDEDDIPDPSVKTEGVVRNSGYVALANLNSSGSGYCSRSRTGLIDAYWANVEYYVVNMTTPIVNLETTIYG